MLMLCYSPSPASGRSGTDRERDMSSSRRPRRRWREYASAGAPSRSARWPAGVHGPADRRPPRPAPFDSCSKLPHQQYSVCVFFARLADRSLFHWVLTCLTRKWAPACGVVDGTTRFAAISEQKTAPATEPRAAVCTHDIWSKRRYDVLPACAGFPREFAETTTVFFTGAGSPYVRIYLHDESVVIFDFSLILSLFFFFCSYVPLGRFTDTSVPQQPWCWVCNLLQFDQS